MHGTQALDALRAKLDQFGSAALTELRAATIVVLPSITFPSSALRKIIGIERYEERLLCFALLLREPTLEIVYPTSMPIDPAIVDYYLSFLDDPDSARRRLHQVSLGDPAPRALSAKLLERPEALAQIKAAVRDPDRALILPFNVTALEAEIEMKLEIPMLGPHPDLISFGTKSGARAIADAAVVPILDGDGDLQSLEDVAKALHELRVESPPGAAAVIKLNNGFSGQGNAIVDLHSLSDPLDQSPTVFCASEESWPSYAQKIEEEGAIVERLLRGPGVVSPSVQVRITPDGTSRIISTHDQILGGPDDQVYLGCRFPAATAYRTEISAHALAIARELSARGVIGWFGMDFVIAPGNGDRDIFLSEINLRLGGTTHPFVMAQLVTGGTYDQTSGRLIVDGAECSYVATDNLKSPNYLGMSPQRAIAAVRDARLAYDSSTRSGVLLHLLGALEPYGKLGLLCIAASQSAAESLHEEAISALDRTAKRGRAVTN